MLLIGSASYAQRLHVTDDALDIAVLSMEVDGPAMASMEMRQELNLTEEQYTQVAQLNQSRYQQLQQAEVTFAHDPSMRNREFINIHSKNDKELKAVLTPQQLREYQELEGRMHLQMISEKEE